MPDTDAIPAATVILLRDGKTGLETLMLHRTSQVAFGGMWVFPGGRVDDEDRRPDDEGDVPAARRAAAREAAEECDLSVDEADLVTFSHWTPPPESPRRYITWFFAARASDGDVTVDGGEIHDHAWLTPAAVLERRSLGEVDLAPPTYVTLSDLAVVPDVESALALARSRDPVPHYATKWSLTPGGALAMWHGDAGYDTGDPDLPGDRHRLWMHEDGWRYERT